LRLHALGGQRIHRWRFPCDRKQRRHDIQELPFRDQRRSPAPIWHLRFGWLHFQQLLDRVLPHYCFDRWHLHHQHGKLDKRRRAYNTISGGTSVQAVTGIAADTHATIMANYITASSDAISGATAGNTVGNEVIDNATAAREKA